MKRSKRQEINESQKVFFKFCGMASSAQTNQPSMKWCGGCKWSLSTEFTFQRINCIGLLSKLLT